MTGKVLPVLPYSWQQSQWQQLQKLIENERLPHALLLSGCSDIGKLRFARAYRTFEAILKDNPDDATTRLFLNKTLECIASGVPDDWTGIERMTAK